MIKWSWALCLSDTDAQTHQHLVDVCQPVSDVPSVPCLPVDYSWSYHATGSAHMTVRPCSMASLLDFYSLPDNFRDPAVDSRSLNHKILMYTAHQFYDNALYKFTFCFAPVSHSFAVGKNICLKMQPYSRECPTEQMLPSIPCCNTRMTMNSAPDNSLSLWE